MKDKDWYTIGRKSRLAFYILMVVIFCAFIAGEIRYPSEHIEESREENLQYKGTFFRIHEDGSRELVAVPGKCEVSAGETLMIATTLPEDGDGTALAIRSSLQSMRFYVDGQLRMEYDTAMTRPFGKDSASRYVFCPITAEDRGKELRIELTSNTVKYSGVINPVYYGDKGDIWALILNSNGVESAIALFMFFVGMITIFVSTALGITYKTKFDIDYLGWCILMGAVWMIGESKLRQLWIPNASVLAALCFVIVMVCPIPILFYVDSIQKGRYHKIYRWLEGAAVVNLVVCTILQLAGVADFIETLPVAHAVIIVTFVIVFITFVKDMSRGVSKDYRLAVIGIMIAMISVAVELISVYFVVTVSGLFIGIGLCVLLFLNIIRTVRHVRDMEQNRQRQELNERRKQMERISLQTIKTLSATVEAKDKYTRGHSQRVAEYAALLAKEYGFGESEITNLKNAAYLHDVGMIGIPDSIVGKPTALTPEEYALIQKHTIIGADILKEITLIDHVAEVARFHHERYDGTGYPDALAGENIPIEARIMAVADSYDAMNSKRIYRDALTREQIIHEFRENRGKQFDPKLTDIFLRLYEQGLFEKAEGVTEPVSQSELEHYEKETTKFISEIMHTMANQENQDNVDFLTNLPVRSRGETLIAQLVQEHDGGLVFIDMDNLKKINDVYGHKAGDRALKLLGHLLANADENSLACRLGGDEFLFFMPDCSEEQLRECLEHMFASFSSEKDKDVELRCANLSAGIYMNHQGEAFENCYMNADKALYRVKLNGKGRYLFYHELEKESLVKQGTGRDLALVAQALRQSGSYHGALDLDYRSFAKVYEYVNSLGERYKHNCFLVMVTMETLPDQVMYMENIERALECMEKAITEKIRKVDVCTRFSSMQYLIILFEAKEDQIGNVMARAFAQYYKNYEKYDFVPRYEYIPMMEQKGDEGS